MSSTDGVTNAEEAPSMSVVGQGIAGDQASRSKETIISIQEGFQLSNDDLEKLSCLDEPHQDEATEQPLIRKIPSLLRARGIKEFHKYFQPTVIAIGPIHHDDACLKPAEKLKLKLASYFINKHGFEKEILYAKIKEEIGNLKKCYDPKEIGKYDDEKLTWMFFLDGCAVLQAIYVSHAPDPDVQQEESEELNIKIDLLTLMYLDFFLLENQIPYRVLDLLTSSSSICSHSEMFKKSIEDFIDDNVITPNEKLQRQQKQRKEQEPAHLLALLRARLLDETGKKRNTTCCKDDCNRLIRFVKNLSSKSSHHTFRNVKELRAAGIWLKPSGTSCLKDISFRRVFFVGKLWLPPIRVDDSTGPKFMNLIAYEMCPDFNNDFSVTSYICFLDSLIDEAEDVKALRDADILDNGLGSDEEVAKLFNKMNTDLVPNPRIYSQVIDQIQRHCRNKWIKYAAQAYHTHFTSPWTFLAFVGAIAALILSALQTYYTIIPKKDDSNNNCKYIFEGNFTRRNW